MTEAFDLLIIGGGINGAGIARDAAGRGLKVVLVEQADLASATSSASTKLIHGGLRYLEFFEFRLVREALMERERLLAIAPHIIRPMEFILPHVAGLRPRWQIRTGLFLYDHIGGRRKLPASHNVKLDHASTFKPELKHGFSYADCWVDDSRLVVLNAMDAAARGAAIHTRMKFWSASIQGDRWRVRCEDVATGAPREFLARAIVNAAGPWVERVLQGFDDARVEAQVRLVKGSHIVTPQLYAGAQAHMLQNPDGRIVFTIPYEQRFTLIGTTDVSYEGEPDQVSISPDEIEYLCATVNSYFRRQISPSDVRWTYSGVRPLSDDDESSASKVTRDYRLELAETSAGPVVLSVFGGKITTYRKLAEAALEKLQPHLGFDGKEWTDQSALPGGDLPNADFDAFLAGVKRRWPFLEDAQAQRMARAYGTRIERILGRATSMLDLGEHFGAGFTSAELDYLRAHEWARTNEDVLWRRTKIGLHLYDTERARFEQTSGLRA